MGLIRPVLSHRRNMKDAVDQQVQHFVVARAARAARRLIQVCLGNG